MEFFLCNRREYVVPQTAVRLYALRTLNTLSGQFDFLKSYCCRTRVGDRREVARR